MYSLLRVSLYKIEKVACMNIELLNINVLAENYNILRKSFNWNKCIYLHFNAVNAGTFNSHEFRSFLCYL